MDEREKCCVGGFFSLKSELEVEGEGEVGQLSPTLPKSPDVGIDLGYSVSWDRARGIRGREGRFKGRQ